MIKSKSFSVTIFLLFSLHLLSQNSEIHEEAFYKLIEKIAYEDTIIRPSAIASIKNGIKNGKYNQEDISKYISIIRSKKPAIFETTSNSTLKKILYNELTRDNSILLKNISKNEIENIIKNISKEKTLENKFSSEIYLMGKNSKKEFAHLFSSPVWIEDNRYLLYHFNHNNSIGGTAELIIAEIKDDSYIIENRIFLWTS